MFKDVVKQCAIVHGGRSTCINTFCNIDSIPYSLIISLSSSLSTLSFSLSLFLFCLSLSLLFTFSIICSLLSCRLLSSIVVAPPSNTNHSPSNFNPYFLMVQGILIAHQEIPPPSRTGIQYNSVYYIYILIYFCLQ